ncbi:acyl-CoA dehydrogenase [Streptomyces luteolifulvus]|uniref:Acyl-CoA dehydrogenase n=1 Tax=Streptomyces luteolifulvus TaxID=2615112 RepID=A0A6H9UNP8_9ACTN|nr:acyl-CoA dehydrogenase family protein [Streptomyces luteolifulvus]KAB1139345.1 acyl-CoA dehydrogenase [Streptomyces luteolifulvus]
MTVGSLLYTDVEDDLRAAVSALLADRCQPSHVAALYDGVPVDAGLWQGIAHELGLAGLLVSEDLGGAGASARETAVVLEELGRAVAPVPFLTSSVIATQVLLESGSDLVRGVASGQERAALVVPWSTAPGSDLPQLSVAEGALCGRVRSVAGVLDADLLLVPVPGDAGADLYAVRASEVDARPVVSLDMSRQLADVDLTGAHGIVIASGPPGAAAVQRGLMWGAGLLASEQLGVARWCFDTSLAYVKERRQFGRAVGGFQAVKHRLADLFVQLEGAAAAARYAAGALADDADDVEVAVAVAVAYCSDIAVHVAEETIQLHGGIGMTWEHPAHLYLKRAKAGHIALGTAGWHRTRLADLVDLPASPANILAI